MLKSIVFLLVLISFITTPTKAYEAYNISSLLVLELQQEEFEKQNILNIEQSNISPIKVSKEKQPQPYEMCSIAISDVEKTHQIKENLMQTIASVESGRYVSSIKKRVAWPWSVHSQGKGYYYQTKEEAIQAVKEMQKQGITNIDVGCMQINLKYHGSAFSSLEEAFDPTKNVTYSAKFLKKLYKRNQSWEKTAMQYHSKNISKGTIYKNKLVKHFAKYIRNDEKTMLF